MSSIDPINRQRQGPKVRLGTSTRAMAILEAEIGAKTQNAKGQNEHLLTTFPEEGLALGIYLSYQHPAVQRGQYSGWTVARQL